VRLLPLLAATLLAAGCGGDDENAAPPTTATTAAAKSRCTPATSDLMTPLANKLLGGDIRLTNGWVLESRVHEDVYLVAAEVDGSELQSSGDVGVWATTSPHGADAIYSVNDLAKEQTDWRDANAIDVSESHEDVREARACVLR
jgi:nitrous oxide reductase accessory protein NosL